MILVDTPKQWPVNLRKWKYGASAHLASDLSLEELHEFAQRLGLRRDWFQGHHYDITARRYEAAVRAGAVQVSSRELVKRMVRS